ncbi:hypothetical protein R6Q59_006113 [Mikania micrantha]
MFVRESIKLLGSIAEELLKNNDEFDGEDIILQRFNTLLERKITFKIQVKEYNLRQNVEYYTISKLSEDESIIRVTISLTGDNAKPLSTVDKFNDVTFSSSQLSNYSNGLLKGLKRNLEHFMLEGEDMCAQSSSKLKIKQEKQD